MAPTNDGGDDEHATAAAASDDDNLRELFTKKLLHRTGAEAGSWSRITLRFARFVLLFFRCRSALVCDRHRARAAAHK